MTARVIVLVLCVALLLFGVDFSGVRERRIFGLAAVPLLFALVLVLVRRWRQFE